MGGLSKEDKKEIDLQVKRLKYQAKHTKIPPPAPNGSHTHIAIGKYQAAGKKSRALKKYFFAAILGVATIPFMPQIKLAISKQLPSFDRISDTTKYNANGGQTYRIPSETTCESFRHYATIQAGGITKAITKEFKQQAESCLHHTIVQTGNEACRRVSNDIRAFESAANYHLKQPIVNDNYACLDAVNTTMRKRQP